MTRLYLTQETGVSPFVDHPDGTVSYHPERTDVLAADPCAQCGRHHPALWIIRRVPVDLGLAFYGFRINGAVRAPDMSIPYTVDRLPRDARPVSAADAVRLWHEDNESHVFGGPNVARALRETIAAHNAEVTR